MSDYYSYESRDMRCASDVGRMAALGRFDKELSVYGCAYVQHGQLYYRVSSNQEAIQKFFVESAHQQIYPTLIEKFCRFTPVPSGMMETLMTETKYLLAKKMKIWYPEEFCDRFSKVANAIAVDSAREKLFALLDQIRYQFDLVQYHLFLQVLEMVYLSRMITDQTYSLLKEQVFVLVRQFDDDPIISERFKRTLYGFCYLDQNKNVKVRYDAQRAVVFEKYIETINKGYLVAPIIEQVYYFDDFNQYADIRQQFGKLLQDYENIHFFEWLQELWALPSAIDREAFEALYQTPFPDKCKQTLEYYGKIWHIF